MRLRLRCLCSLELPPQRRRRAPGLAEILALLGNVEALAGEALALGAHRVRRRGELRLLRLEARPLPLHRVVDLLRTCPQLFC